jgi:hypothetical protein
MRDSWFYLGSQTIYGLGDVRPRGISAEEFAKETERAGALPAGGQAASPQQRGSHTRALARARARRRRSLSRT